MNIAIAGDHAGFQLKEWLRGKLERDGHTVIDLGARDTTPSEAVVSGRAERGILVCGSGVGASIAANKIRGIRAGLAHEPYSGHQGVEHDDMNVLCMGSRVIGPEVALETARAFVKARFSGEERHVRRVNKVLDIERHSMGG